MSVTIIMKDALRESVEAASGGKQTVLRTSKGHPSYMNVIPRFRCEDIHPTALGIGTHPAFQVGGIEKNEIFIGTYQAIIHDGQALSLPYQTPATSINFDAAKTACLAAGPGFHLMTNWEWAAIALWCIANGHDVRGNTEYGRSHSNHDERGMSSAGNVILTGSGPASWRHDGTMHGIADLVGNVWEWNDGLKLIGGKIIMPPDNNYALPETDWPETGAGFDIISGSPTISDNVTERDWDSERFQDVGAKEGFELPNMIKQAMLCPCADLQAAGRLYADNDEGFEALPFRGGDWGDGADAGLASLSLDCERSDSHSALGFRPAFIE
jgi:hypothetical protein